MSTGNNRMPQSGRRSTSTISMNTIGQKERKTQQRVVELFREKQGMMQELLTGKMRLI